MSLDLQDSMFDDSTTLIDLVFPNSKIPFAVDEHLQHVDDVLHSLQYSVPANRSGRRLVDERCRRYRSNSHKPTNPSKVVLGEA